MKKVSALMLCLAMLMSLAACGNTTSNSSQPPEQSQAVQQTQPGSEGDSEGYTGGSYSLQMGHIGAEGSIEDVVTNRFIELVAEKSGGKIEITPFGNSQMGGLTDLVDAIRYDTLDLALFAAGNLESIYAQGTILGVPYLFSSYEHVEAFYKSEAWAGVIKDMAAATNCLDLGDFHTGFRVILSNTEINSADDMKGLSIRVPEAPSFVKTFGALGCNTTALPATDVYQALQTGLVQATEAAPSYMVSMNYHDVSDYCIVTNHIYTGNSIFISQNKLNSMDEAAQQVIREAAAQAAEEALAIVAEQDEAAMDAFEAAGVTIVNPDLDSFKSAMTDVWGELFTDTVDGGQELLDAALACDPAK